MPQLECRPEVVFPERLEARLFLPGNSPAVADPVLAVVSLTWDWLGWGRYAFPIERGNCHVHLNLTCQGASPERFGLHCSLYGQTHVSDFLRPVSESYAPLRLEFVLNVPGQLLAEQAEAVPLRIVITPAGGQTITPDEPFPWPLYGMTSDWTSDDSSGWASDLLEASGSVGVGFLPTATRALVRSSRESAPTSHPITSDETRCTRSATWENRAARLATDNPSTTRTKSRSTPTADPAADVLATSPPATTDAESPIAHWDHRSHNSSLTSLRLRRF
jgi:hypothetical protein